MTTFVGGRDHSDGAPANESRPVFTVVVPAKRPFLERLKETIGSIANQRAVLQGRCGLRLRVVGSEWDRDCTSWLEDQSIDNLHFEEDKSSGLYQAVSQGLYRQDGDVFGYLGVGDTYEPQAFDLILENMDKDFRSGPWWITGMIVGRRTDGAIVRTLTPFRYRRHFFEAGIHGSLLPTIQQESTFWSRSLNEGVNWQTVSALSLAGDYELWRQFSAICEPLVIEAVVGSFRWHGDNLSADWARYWTEVELGNRRSRAYDRLRAHVERVVWAMPPRIKARLASGHLRRYAWPEGPWVP